MKHRIIVFDIMRAICAIHIVAFWHDISYYYPDSQILRFGSVMTTAALACFTFLSGLLNGNKKIMFRSFYYNRTIRLYLPYIIAFIVLSLIGFVKNSSFASYFYPLTGLSCFFGFQPDTLWFVCMLLVFYFLTPFLVWNVTKESFKGKIFIAIRCLSIFCIFLLLEFFLKKFDHRLNLYFCFYAIGLLVSPSRFVAIFSEMPINRLFLLSVSFLLGMFTTAFFFRNLDFIGCLIGFLGVLFILSFSHILKRFSIISRVMVKISYASMFAYLFHRFFNYIIIFFVGNHAMLSTILMILIIFPICYGLQVLYDKIVASIYR